MGCTSSKQARRDRDRHRHRSPAPYFRSHSMPIHHIDSPRKPGSCSISNRHFVALTSSTLGSLRVESEAEAEAEAEPVISDDELVIKATTRDEVVSNAKSWSDMITSKIPKTPTKTPCNEPETINAWELMEGLEEAEVVAPCSPKPLWMQLNPGETIVSDFDPDIISNFRKAMEELSPNHQCFLKSSPEPAARRSSVVASPRKHCDYDADDDKTPTPTVDGVARKWDVVLSTPRCDSEDDDDETPKFEGIATKWDVVLSTPQCDSEDVETPKINGIVKARVNAFQQKIDAKRGKKCPPDGEKKVVLYFTSLRGIRKTYEDCWNTKIILQGYRVKLDERDVSIHGGFKKELSEILGVGFGGSRLPRVFVNGEHLGGVEEVKRMHESGELGKALEECELVVFNGKLGEGCEGCGNVRFVPCGTCSGSCKVFVEEEEEGEEEGLVVGGFRRCPDCNENGLVRCSFCL